MARRLRISEFLLGVEGLALLRGMFTGTDSQAERRLDEVRAIVADEEGNFGGALEVPELEVSDGYGRWSSTYDRPGNPLVSAEQPAVWALLDAAPPARALDAACGTGRHARHLAGLGHEVTGVDRTPAMLAAARERVPEASFVEGDLMALPFEDGSFDLLVCALALEHVGDLVAAVSELARVVRPGGRIVISESHPVLRSIGGAPFFIDATGGAGVVRSHPHLHGDYLDSFAAAPLDVHDCIEVRFGPEQVAMQQPAATFFPEAAEGAFLGLPAVLIWDLAVPA